MQRPISLAQNIGRGFTSIFLIILALSGCVQPPSETLLSGEAQGTTYHIKFVLNKEKSPKLDDIQQLISTTLDQIDAKLSNYRDDSEISIINRTETSEWISTSKEIIELLAVAKIVHEKSQGCFDLTIKPLFDLWGFSQHEPKIPKQSDIDALLPHIGMNLLEVDLDGHRLRKKDPKLKIDLAGIAQGYSVGQVAKQLEGLGIENYMVEIGGEMMVKGRKADGQAWRIGIEAPTPSSRTLNKVITLNKPEAKAVMTAGTYRNFFDENGKTYSHILNPKTGWPVNHHLHSVTVIHSDPTWADAWDTALLCMGEENAIKVSELEKLNVFLVYANNNQSAEYTSKTFADSL
jgi:thiamine biosynthesis lipoprotein